MLAVLSEDFCNLYLMDSNVVERYVFSLSPAKEVG